MTRQTYDLGLHMDMPLDHYYADPAKADHGSLNASNIPVLREKSPLHFATRSPVLTARYSLTPAKDTPSAASRRGNVVHRFALGKGCEYEVRDYPDFRTKEAREWRDAMDAAGRSALLEKDMPGCQLQADLLRAHLDELFMGQEWFPEVAVLWTEETPFGVIHCRALVDAWCPKLVHGADIKSTTNASRAHALKRLEQGGYDVQNAWYSRGLERALDLGHNVVQFTTLFGETGPPHASQGFQLTDMWKTSAWDECQLAMRTFAQCQAADKFPGYPRSALRVPPPPWLITRRMEAELHVDDLNDDAGLIDTSAPMPPPPDDDQED